MNLEEALAQLMCSRKEYEARLRARFFQLLNMGKE